MITGVLVKTVVGVTMGNVAVFACADTVRVPGTIAAALLLDKATVVPQFDGGQKKVSFPVVFWPPVRTDFVTEIVNVGSIPIGDWLTDNPFDVEVVAVMVMNGITVDTKPAPIENVWVGVLWSRVKLLGVIVTTGLLLEMVTRAGVAVGQFKVIGSWTVWPE
jgi:hypothetical protein